MLKVIEYFSLVLFLIYFIQSNIIFHKIVTELEKGLYTKFFTELLECRTCLGFWVALGINFIFRLSLLETFININFIPLKVFDIIVTAMFVTFVQNLIANGWKVLYQITYVK